LDVDVSSDDAITPLQSSLLKAKICPDFLSDMVVWVLIDGFRQGSW
jgi:hypothetical protein